MRREIRDKHLKRITLGEWEEYVGWLEGVEEGPEGWVAIFDHAAVALPVVTDAPGIRRFVGRKVGILRTDELERPICIRVLLGSSQPS